MMVSMLMGDINSLQVPKNLLGPGEPVEADQLAQTPLPTVQDHVAVLLRMFPFNLKESTDKNGQQGDGHRGKLTCKENQRDIRDTSYLFFLN
jgi:hypothetical protein